MGTKALIISLLAANVLVAHCDTLDGPVAKAAQRAIASGDVNPVLPWVQPDHEPAIRQAFIRTMNVRKLNAAAESLADSWFFETLARIHRTGEGASYTGLKPAGSAVSNAVREADQAVATADLQILEKALSTALKETLRERFARILSTKEYQSSNVSAGRQYVAAYVDFIHLAERLESALVRKTADEHLH